MRFWIKQGDKGPPLVMTLVNDKGEVVDTTALDSGRFLMRSREDNSVVIDNAISFLSPRTDGRVQYDWQANDTLLAGEFDAEIEVVDGAAAQTYPTDGFIEVVVAPSIDNGDPNAVPSALLQDLRRATGEIGETTYLDTTLSEVLINRQLEVDAAAYDVWTWKAADYANLVTVNEGGSSRAMSDLLDHALKMIELYRSRSVLVQDDLLLVVPVRSTRTRRIVRE